MEKGEEEERLLLLRGWASRVVEVAVGVVEVEVEVGFAAAARRLAQFIPKRLRDIARSSSKEYSSIGLFGLG